MKTVLLCSLLLLSGCAGMDCPPPITLSKAEFESPEYQDKCILRGKKANEAANTGIIAGAPFMIF
jgi:hypothetical protein